ncbi:MAG: hypothetical protein FWC71_11720 [Defluviitaleaceae bacterium]|nr:hypothetical protein [Defluviitaleaceae bacterium]
MDCRDWIMFAATLGGGIIAALATFFAVWLTNKKTAKMYEEELRHRKEENEIQRKEKAMVIIKPRTMRNTIEGVLDTIIMRNSLDRVLLFSGADGFDFVNQSTIKDDGKKYAPKWRFVIMENESQNEIYSVKLTTHSKLTTNSNAIFEYSTSNFVALLRSKESIAVRIENSEQWNKLDEAKEIIFTSTIEYLTAARQQVCYNFAVKITDLSSEVLEDKFTVSDNITLPGNCIPTVYRNLQDDIGTIDRSAYAWEKIGAAQLRGFANNSLPTRPNSADFDALMGYAEKLIGFVFGIFSKDVPENQTEKLIEKPEVETEGK